MIVEIGGVVLPRLERPRWSLKPLGSDVRRGSEDTAVSFEIDDGPQSMLWPRRRIAD
jgi:hypothetical protein